jgi:hypothetical protein
MNLKLDMDNPADREKLRRAVLELSPGEKCQSKNGLVEILSFTSRQAFCSCDSTLLPRAPIRLRLGS